MTISIDPTNVKFLHQNTYMLEYTDEGAWNNCLSQFPILDDANWYWGDSFTYDNWPSYNAGAIMASEDSRPPRGYVNASKQKMFLEFNTTPYTAFYSPKLVIEFCYKAELDLIYLNSTWVVNAFKIAEMPLTASDAIAIVFDETATPIPNIAINNVSVNFFNYTQTYDLDDLDIGSEDFVLVFDRFENNTEQPSPITILAYDNITLPAAFVASNIRITVELTPPGPQPTQYGTMSVGNSYSIAPPTSETTDAEQSYATYIQGLELPTGTEVVPGT